MKDLQLFLSKMENKTALVSGIIIILTFLISSSDPSNPAPLFGPVGIIWMNFAAGLLLIGFKAIAPTGSLPSGWTKLMIVVNLAAMFFEAGTFISDSGLFSDSVVAVIAKIQAALNGLMALGQLGKKESVS